MVPFHLPAASSIGHAHLQISNLEQGLHFYRDLIGLRETGQAGKAVALSAAGNSPPLILLAARTNAKPKPPHTTGLFHVAIRFPNRRELARIFRRLVDQGWPFQGFADHGVSEALYLADADDNGVELYADRPGQQWHWRNGEVFMSTAPLDVDGLLREIEQDPVPPCQIHPKTDIGHIHLQVSDLQRAEAFYHGVLGLQVTQRSYPGALFLSAGGYHHHLGLNTWAGQGALPPPPEAVGLLAFSIQVPNQHTLGTLADRVQSAKMPLQDHSAAISRPAFTTRDPDGNAIVIEAE